jgi:hypothetical protein
MLFTSNLLALNFDETQYMEFRPINYYNVTTKVNYKQISLTNVTETKFLGLIIDDTLTWKQHIEYLKKKKFHSMFCIKKYKGYSLFRCFKLICFANMHSIISYSIIFLVPTRFLYYK